MAMLHSPFRYGRQDLLLLRFGAHPHDGGTNRHQRQHGNGDVVVAERQVKEDVLIDGRTPLSPVFPGPPDAHPPILAQLPDELLAERPFAFGKLVYLLVEVQRGVLLKVRLDFLLELLLFRSEFEVHVQLL